MWKDIDYFQFTQDIDYLKEHAMPFMYEIALFYEDFVVENEDGAVREWIDDHYIDNYCHRHHSHLYPVFPGNEVDEEHPLYHAFVKAEDRRLQFGLSDQSSWSLVFIAGIAARMKRSETALKAIDTIARTCLMNNFFTVHNDWRRMGPIACADFRAAPFQIDGNIGIPGVINEMLLQSHKSTFEESRLVVLPALPDKWSKGQIRGLLARGNILVDIVWNEDGGYVKLRGDRRRKVRLSVGSSYTFGHENECSMILGKEEIRLTFSKNRCCEE